MSGTKIFTELAEARFFDEWSERFNDEMGKFITPDNPLVRKWSEGVDILPFLGREDRAKRVWLYVYNNTEYKLSKKWKTPQETIKSRIGDCEDFTFLIASMLMNVGVEESVIALGEIKYPSGRREYHTWNEVGGATADATGSPDSVSKVNYIPHKKWKISKSGK